MHLENGEPARARDVLTAALAHARGSEADEILDLLGDVYAALGSEPHEIDQQLQHLRSRGATSAADDDEEGDPRIVVSGLLVIAFVGVTSVIGIITILRWLVAG